MIDALHLLRDVDTLRAIGRTLIAPDAMAGLPQSWYTAVITNQESLSCLVVIFIMSVSWHISLIDTFIIM